jgi:acid phosphatase type 7
VFVGAGDIGHCDPEYMGNAEATARLLDATSGTIFTTGDNVQKAGAFEEYRDCFSPTWHRHVGRIRPSPGNHDYQTASGAAYFSYFGAAAGPSGLGYYSYDLGAWHIISLNGNVSMKAGSAQANWLKQDLDASRALCTLAYWHQPLFTSSTHGYDATSLNAWQLLYDHGAEVVLNGHDHWFERFAPQDPSGRRDDARGIRQFTVGTGGYALYDLVRLQPNSEVHGSAHGVLKLTLRGDSYDWQFIPIAGASFTDSGTGTCHAR